MRGKGGIIEAMLTRLNLRFAALGKNGTDAFFKRRKRSQSPFSVALCILCLGPLALMAASKIKPAPAKPPAAATRPATAPASTSPAATQAAQYPLPELVAQCRQAAKEMAARLDNSFECIVEPPFVVFGNYPQGDVRRSVDSCVIQPARAMWSGYFQAKPDHPITVLLFNDDKSYRDWAKKLFDDEDVSHFGYYKPDARTMVMNISTGGGTLIHELTHALIAYDFPDVPQWFNEALGSLHEGCQVGADEIVGLPNWRLAALQEAIKKGSLRPLRQTVTLDDFYGDLRGLNYAQGRYFAMYMQHEGLLKKFYAAYRRDHDGAESAVKAIEAAFGKKIDAVDKAFIEYVKTLKY